MKMAYKRIVSYYFECDGEYWSMDEVPKDAKRIYIEETRKNGQEDCHMALELTKNEKGEWEADEYDMSQGTVATYSGKGTVKELIDYVNKYGVPGSLDTL